MKKLSLLVLTLMLGISFIGCSPKETATLEKKVQEKEAETKEKEKQPLDYSSIIGISVKEFSGRENMTLKKDEEMSAVLGTTSMVGDKEEDFAGLSGTTRFRSFPDSDNKVPANHIFDANWTVGDPSDDSEIIDIKTVESLVKQYDEYYGKHTESEDSYGENDVVIYSWALEDNKIFEITVYVSLNFISLHWLFEN